MFEYNIQEVKKEKIKYVEYMGPLAEYCDELKVDSLSDLLLKMVSFLDEEYNEEVVKNLVTTLIPSHYINTILELKNSKNKSMAFNVYKKLRGSLIYPKRDNDTEPNAIKNISTFFDECLIVMDITGVDVNEGAVTLNLSIGSVRKEDSGLRIAIEGIDSNCVNGILGFATNGKLYIISCNNNDEDKSVFISYNPIDRITYLKSDKVNNFLIDPVDNNSIEILKRKGLKHIMDYSHLVRFIEEELLETGVDNIFTQALIPYKLSNIANINKQYMQEKQFTFNNKVNRFEIMLRAIQIIFNLKASHSTVRVTPFKKLFNDMDRYVNSYKNGKRKGKKKDLEPFKYNSHLDHKWTSDSFGFKEGLNGDKRYISRKNNDMVIMLLFLYDEKTLPTNIVKIVDKNIRSFRKTDSVIQLDKE